MDNTLIIWISIIVISATGTLAHFLYDLTGEHRAVGLFIFFGCHMTLTLEPLKTFLFKDPTTGKYGFRAHRNFFKSLKRRRKK